MKSVNKLKSLAFKFGCVWTQNPADLASMRVRFPPPAPKHKKGWLKLANPFYVQLVILVQLVLFVKSEPIRPIRPIEPIKQDDTFHLPA